jgi:hypothetical protein
MDSLAFPFTFDDTGLQKLEENSYDYFRQMLTISMLTEPNVHPITPGFGILDPTFSEIDAGSFVFQAAQYIPEVEIVSFDSKPSNDDGQRKISFTFRVVG